jgi:hypothetical protein
MAGLQQNLSIFIVAMIVVVVNSENFYEIHFSKPVFKLISRIKTALGSQFRNKSYKLLLLVT